MNRKIDEGCQISTALTPHQRILRLREVCALTGLSRSFIYQLQAEGRFPRGSS